MRLAPVKWIAHTGVAHTLPGVFESTPYKLAINGSLWTLNYEVRMYALLLVAWLLMRSVRIKGFEAFKVFVVICAVGSGGFVLARFFLYDYVQEDSAKLVFMFSSGAAFYVLRDRIELSTPLFWMALAALAALAASTIERRLFVPTYFLTAAYLTFYLAYVPGGVVRRFNRFGDYSYGVYVYAFPVPHAANGCGARPRRVGCVHVCSVVNHHARAGGCLMARGRETCTCTQEARCRRTVTAIAAFSRTHVAALLSALVRCSDCKKLAP